MKLKWAFLLLLLLSLHACKDTKEDDNSDVELTDDQFTNRWAYNKMKSLYLWNTELPSNPNYTQASKAFFESILYNYGSVNGDRFSWIEEDTSKKTKALYADTNLGFEYLPMNYFPELKEGVTNYTSIGFFVLYVYEDSDAYKKGLRRGQVISNVNGTKVDYDNYKTLLRDVSSVNLLVYNNSGKLTELKSIQTAEQKKSPVFISKVIPGTKIGYLMYTGFERNSDDKDDNYEYDIELIESIKTLNSQGITEFVLDLRYNPGGYLTSAMDLASALVPNRKTSNIFAKEAYNKHFEDSIIKNHGGTNALNEYFLNKVYGTNTAIPNLNLTRLYVLAGEYTASASELIIHALRPYMTVAHIGETTVGKDKASMTVKSNNERIKWQLQPLISRLTDKDGKGNYINGLKPGIGTSSGDASYEVSEWDEGYTMVNLQNNTRCPNLSKWIGGFGELGDPSEPLLAEAIAKITGVARVKTKSAVSTSDWVPVQAPKLKYNEERQRIIIDQDKFSKK